MSSLDHLKALMPEYARDVKLNLGTVLDPEGAEGLTQEQIAGIALACAYATQHTVVIEHILGMAKGILDEKALNAAKIAATIMAMNNVYYRFLHLSGDPTYQSMPAKLRMQGMMRPGVSTLDFELYALAVSAINGCGLCMESHNKKLVSEGVSREGIQSSVRIAAVIHSAAQALSIEAL